MNYYVTTSIPYVNGDPHIGFAMELLMADVLARNARQQGFPTIFSTGTDEQDRRIFKKLPSLELHLSNSSTRSVSASANYRSFSIPVPTGLYVLQTKPTSKGPKLSGKNWSMTFIRASMSVGTMLRKRSSCRRIKLIRLV